MQQFIGRQVAQLRTHFPDYEPTSLLPINAAC